MGVKLGGSPSGLGSRGSRPALPPRASADVFSAAIADLTDRWARGEPVAAESYLSEGRLWPADRAVELVYREYRLATEAGLSPSRSVYLERFPEHRGALERLLALDAACPDSLLGRLRGTDDGDDDPLPVAGDAIGPYVLERELGEGGFARVFLARQADLADRPVVVKVTTRPTREPWLLARAQHPNIVEVLTHAEVDDGALQLIVMPFLGGASLSAVLSRRRSRPAGGRPSRFLDDLDATASPEFRPGGASGPSRAVLRAMSDAEAFAWVAARLAEALDHARRRGVAHGDVKPSNVLIAADGTPMLLDFNLAQDWTDADAVDAGGTMAYMAPERLLALSGEGAPADDERAHRADVYSLGMVLLEALTGWSPAAGADPCRPAGRSAFVAAARAMAEARRRPAWVIRRAEVDAGRSLPAGLRAILRHCLGPEPAARYARGLELAEDLDRWRADRPLAFAPEPSRLHVAGRWARRRRRPLATAAAGLLIVGMVAWLSADGRSAQAGLERSARHKYSQLLDLPDSRALLFQHPGEDLQRRRPAVVVADALRALRLYSVADDPAWRARGDFARLPRDDRDDLEAWLLEQALRYGRALARREDSPDDWRRARDVLDNACGDVRPAVMAELRGRLTDRIGDGDGDGAPPAPRRPAHPAVDAYLRGVSAEIDDDEAEANVDFGARRAAGFYAEMLAIRPRSFWGRYRAAVVAFALARWDEAADDLRACLALRPDNPLLHGVHGTCLMMMGREDEALDECSRGIDLAPDHAELVQVRAFVRASGPSLDALRGDILRYERLRAALPDRFLREPDADGVASIGRDLPLSPRRDVAPSQDLDEVVGSGELDARAVLASRIVAVKAPESGRPPMLSYVDTDPRRLALAAREVEKLLALDPSNLSARVLRMWLAVCRRSPSEARRDLEVILTDPRLPEYARFAPARLDALHYTACLFAAQGDFISAHALARKLVDLALKFRDPHARALYTLASVEAYGARTNPKWIPVAAKHLEQAARYNPKYEGWFHEDRLFQKTRPQIQEAVDAIRADADAALRH